jgi:hypothetical protein
VGLSLRPPARQALSGLGRRRDSAPTGVPGARRDFPTKGRSRLYRRPAPPGAADPFGPGSPTCLPAGRRDSAPTGVPGARRAFPTEGRSRLYRRSAPPGAATRHRWRGRPVRAGVAEGIRLLPAFRERAAISQPRVGAGCTGDPRRQARQPGAAGAAGPLGLGRRRDSAPTQWVAEGIRLLPFLGGLPAGSRSGAVGKRAIH